MTRAPKTFVILALVVLFTSALTTAPAWAQGSTAELNGRVTDSSGAVLPGVTVTATQTATGLERATVTDGEGGGFRLDGTKWHVPFASSATRIVVLARTSDAEDGVDLFLVDPDAAGVERAQQFTLGSENQYAVTLSGVRVTEADRIGAPGTGWATWDATLLEGIVLLAAQAICGARAALELTTTVTVLPL